LPTGRRTGTSTIISTPAIYDVSTGIRPKPHFTLLPDGDEFDPGAGWPTTPRQKIDTPPGVVELSSFGLRDGGQVFLA
jgi:hypothetical protein